MAKLFIVCPSCRTKYPVADQKLAGRKVTCKKCSHKFVAEIQGATPPPENELAPIPSDDPFASSASASDPLGDDLFGDFPTSESAVSAPPLGSLPPKQKKTSSGSGFAVVPVLLSVARVTGVAIVVVVTYSSLFPTPGSGHGAPRDNAAFGTQGTGGPPQNNRPFSPSSRDRTSPSSEHPDADRPSAPAPGRPFDPFGQGGRPPGMPNWVPSGPPNSQRFVEQLEQDFGKDKLVRLEHKPTSTEQYKEIVRVLEPYMINPSHASFFDRKAESQVFIFPYEGDLNQLASKITFGEVDEVLVNKRTIRMKSIALP